MAGLSIGIVIKSASSFVILESGYSNILVVRICMGLRSKKKTVKIQQKRLANDKIS